MAEEKKKLIILASHGLEDERSTVAWTIANGGLNNGLEVGIFLVSSAVDMARKGAVDNIRVNPFDPPLKELIQTFMEKGGKVWACPPCSKVRGYAEEDFLEGVIITGSGVIHNAIKEGAATLSL